MQKHHFISLKWNQINLATKNYENKNVSFCIHWKWHLSLNAPAESDHKQWNWNFQSHKKHIIEHRRNYYFTYENENKKKINITNIMEWWYVKEVTKKRVFHCSDILHFVYVYEQLPAYSVVQVNTIQSTLLLLSIHLIFIAIIRSYKWLRSNASFTFTHTFHT